MLFDKRLRLLTLAKRPIVSQYVLAELTNLARPPRTPPGGLHFEGHAVGVTERGQQHDGSAKPLLNDSEQGMQVITDWTALICFPNIVT